MIRTPAIPIAVYRRWPRTSGDDPLNSYDTKLTALLAPHERG